MSLSYILYTLLIGPLEELFEVIYFVSYKIDNNPGLAIILLSVAMNFLLLPLYRRTDAIQDEAIATEKEMKPYVDHIKKTFKGDERFMLLQTCYRQHNYKPTDSLKGITPLLLEIPFFMAAYNFLSNLNLLNGASFWIIKDLSLQDGLLSLGNYNLNLLPILMTVINIISSAIYTKGAPKKTKIQLYGMAALFMILLYDSPSGLVIYWTLNNLFSLIKNIIIKIKFKKMPQIALLLSLIVTFACIIFIWNGWHSFKVKMILTVILILINLLLILKIKHPKHISNKETEISKKDFILYFSACIIMTLLVGLLIPSSVINASPEEFIIAELNLNPNSFYVFNSLLLSAGTFLVWMNMLYFLSNNNWKKIIINFMWVLCGISILGYMCFGTNYGTMSSQLVFDNAISSNLKTILINMILILAVSFVIVIIIRKKRNILITLAVAIIVSMLGMSFANINRSQKTINSKLNELSKDKVITEDLFSLSKTGKNVVVIMMDRAVNSLVPYIFHEKPELKQQFSGFTYYPNTLSFGGHTNFGLPAVFGGYEYTPTELNKRDDELLQYKHEEALKVMPVLFDENEYEVTVCDPTYAGYTNIPDLSIYDEYPNISKYITMGKYNDSMKELPNIVKQRFFRYSIMRICPLFLQKFIYNDGQYLSLNGANDNTQTLENHLVANGRNYAFESSVSVLSSLPKLTNITDEDKNTFLMMCNDTAHSPALLQLPDYEMSLHVDNTEYDSDPMVRVNDEGDTIKMYQEYQIKAYHSNMASYLQIGKWLDYLKENDVYDNTRIIIVSDHGFYLNLREDWKLDYEVDPNSEDHSDIMFYNPLLLVKDFNAQDLTTDETFMTNADTPSIAISGLIDNAINPFTGKEINNEQKFNSKLMVSLSGKFSTSENCGTTYLPDPWAEVTGDDMFNPNNWHIIQPEDLPKN